MKSCVLCLLAVVTFEWSARAAGVASIEAIRAVDHGCLKIPDYEPSSNAVIEVVVSVDDPGKNGTVFCSRNSRWNKESYALCYVGGQGWRFDYLNERNNVNLTGVAVAGRKQTLRCQPDGLYIDGEIKFPVTPASFTTKQPLLLFALYTGSNYAGPYNWGNIRFYSLKAWEPGADGALALRLDLTPCQQSDGRIGVVDAVSGTVYTEVYSNNGFPLAPSLTVRTADELVAALTCINKAAMGKGATYYKGAEVRLEPGEYDLSACAMDSYNHLVFTPTGFGRIVGLGASPEATVLRGGGAATAKRILKFDGGVDVRATVTNVTLTGAYMAVSGANGGAIHSASGNIYYDNCVFRDNYAVGGGAAAYNGIARWSRFERNNGASASGGALRGNGICAACDSVFTDNVATGGTGGACFNLSEIARCRFTGNEARYGGAVAGNNATRIYDCTFDGNACGAGNWGYGGACYQVALASNCTFTANRDGNDAGSYGSVGYGGTLVDCTITNQTARRRIVAECHVTRCYFADIANTVDSSLQPFSVCGNNNTGTAEYTVVNSVFERITCLGESDRIAQYRKLVNCTVRDCTNRKAAGVMFDATDQLVNTIVTGCSPCDMSADKLPARLQNCLWTTQSGAIDAASMPGCIKARPRFARKGAAYPFDLIASSKAFNAGADDETTLALAGELDFARRPRRLFGCIDIGAMEAQDDTVPGFVFAIR